MHMQGAPRTMQHDPRYDDVVAEVHGFLMDRARGRLEGGVAEIWVDPGIGFGKTRAHNLALLRHLPELVAEGLPGARWYQPQGVSRDAGGAGRRCGRLARRPSASLARSRPPPGRCSPGASMVRVHDVATVRRRRSWATARAAAAVGAARALEADRWPPGRTGNGR